MEKIMTALLLCLVLIMGEGMAYNEVQGRVLHVAVTQNATTNQMLIEEMADNHKIEQDETIRGSIQHVLSFVKNERKDDPLVQIKPDIWIKKSNLQGVEVKGKTYYYTLSPHMSFDPVARGEVNKDKVDIVYQEQGEVPIIIYTIRES